MRRTRRWPRPLRPLRARRITAPAAPTTPLLRCRAGACRWRLSAEGVARTATVTEEMERYTSASDFPRITTFNDRKDFMKISRELRDTPGVTVLLFDQTCAAEKRRRRKKGQFPDPDKRLFI